METPQTFWRKCSTCKKEIGFGQTYQVCSVSTCRGKATNYVFCSVMCWDGHLPIERHRADSASAIEKRAPRRDEFEKEQAQEESQKGRRIVVPSTASDEDEVLVVVSKVRKYIADKSGMNTSAGVYTALTERIKRLCERSIEEAKRQNRKTVMDRDVP
jgi:hypothetical protein